MKTHAAFTSLAHRDGHFDADERVLAEERAVAISYNGTTHVVLMATPADLTDLALGFSLTEGIVSGSDQIGDIEAEEGPLGIDLRVWLKDDAASALESRRRNMVGPVGCGLCGIESLEEAMRLAPPVSGGVSLDSGEIAETVAALAAGQSLNARTRSVHAAGFFRPRRGIVALREDVGRHNALDKLVGAVTGDGIDMADGAIVVTSRLSVELVQKCAYGGSGMLIAVSAPTVLAVEMARRANITLVAVVRGGDFEVFTHPERVTSKALSHVS